MEMRDIGDSRRELRLGHNGDNVRGVGGGGTQPSLVSFNYLAKRDTSYVSYKCAFLCMLG